MTEYGYRRRMVGLLLVALSCELCPIAHGGDESSATELELLGLQSLLGKNAPKDEKKGIEYLERAAREGSVSAQHSLAVAYSGNPAVRDEKRALYWFTKAAKKGYARSQERLGYIYATGRGVRKNSKQAVKWCRKAAEQGAPRAQRMLGMWYAHGVEGVRQDYREAEQLLAAAAPVFPDDAELQFSLGLMLERGGHGIDRDYRQALRRYQQAAEQGHAGAQNNLGTMHEHGRGVRTNFEEAYMWYMLAAGAGNVNIARENLALLGRRMNEQQRARARARARRFKPLKRSEMSKPSLGIFEVSVSPPSVSAGSSFELQLEYTAFDPRKRSETLPVLFQYRILKGSEALLTAQPQEVGDSYNGHSTRVSKRIRAASEPGRYRVEVKVTYEDLTKDESINLDIR